MLPLELLNVKCYQCGLLHDIERVLTLIGDERPRRSPVRAGARKNEHAFHGFDLQWGISCATVYVPSDATNDASLLSTTYKVFTITLKVVDSDLLQPQLMDLGISVTTTKCSY